MLAPMAARRSVSWPAGEDEGEIRPIRGRAEVITTAPKLKQMENRVQRASTSTVRPVSQGHVFCCSARLENVRLSLGLKFWVTLLPTKVWMWKSAPNDITCDKTSKSLTQFTASPASEEQLRHRNNRKGHTKTNTTFKILTKMNRDVTILSAL